MTHNCLDWTTNPPTRRAPFLILACGRDRVYTAIPKDFKTLEDTARKEFGLGDVPLTLSSSCANLCDGLPARITESSWEHVGLFIGCATVEVVGPKAGEDPLSQGVSCKEQPVAPENGEHIGDSSDKIRELSNSDREEESKQADRGLGGGNLTEPDQDEQDVVPSDHGNSHDYASAPEDRHEASWDEEVSAILPTRSRIRRRVVSEDEDDGQGSEQEHDILSSSRPQLPPVVSPPKPLQPKVKKGRISDHHSQSTHESSKPIKQEKRESASGRSFSQDDRSRPPLITPSQHDNQSETPAESSQNQKIMIRVAHRRSKQESKFTTKSTTRVGKVLAACCKSFGLDPSHATLYLIIATDDGDGEEENLFPCDRNDSIARAGAERDAESRFLIKIAGEQ